MNRVVFQAYTGSIVYGTQTPLSDVDTISAYVPQNHEKLFCLS
ncbi:hypothetical protein BH09SUM1_BH09SUM1_33980 [soil metagenome]